LQLLRWEYDEETNRIRAVFEDAPLSDDPDPVNFRAARSFTVELLPQMLLAELLPPPAPTESEPYSPGMEPDPLEKVPDGA
jgi:hypothetical protein